MIRNTCIKNTYDAHIKEETTEAKICATVSKITCRPSFLRELLPIPPQMKLLDLYIERVVTAEKFLKGSAALIKKLEEQRDAGKAVAKEVRNSPINYLYMVHH